MRHLTSILVLAAVAWWAVFYLPGTPTWAMLRLKQNIDARDGDEAAKYIDFESVVKKAGNEMMQENGGSNPFGAMLGNGLVEVFAKPIAQIARAWAIKKVDDGAREVQMPGAAVAASLVLMHRTGDTAYTDFKDAKGQEWEIHLARGDGGYWRVTEIKNIGQYLEKLEQEKRLNSP